MRAHMRGKMVVISAAIYNGDGVAWMIMRRGIYACQECDKSESPERESSHLGPAPFACNGSIQYSIQ